MYDKKITNIFKKEGVEAVLDIKATFNGTPPTFFGEKRWKSPLFCAARMCNLSKRRSVLISLGKKYTVQAFGNQLRVIAVVFIPNSKGGTQVNRDVTRILRNRPKREGL